MLVSDKTKAVFFDLQGTLGGAGLDDITTFTFYPYAAEAIKIVNEIGFSAVLITNQSHIAKGHFSIEDFNNKITELKTELSQSGARFDGVYCCPHGSHDNCLCKKPLVGMLKAAAVDLDIDLKSSYVRAQRICYWPKIAAVSQYWC